MKQKTKDKIAKELENVYSNIANRLDKMEKFTLEQAPDICREIVEVEVVKTQNEIIENTVGTSVNFILLIISIVILTLSINYSIKTDGNSIMGILGSIFAGIGVFSFSITFFIYLSGILQNYLYFREIKVSPKLLILKKLSSLLKGL